MLSFSFWQDLIFCRDVAGATALRFPEFARQHLLKAVRHAVYPWCKLKAFLFKNCIN